MNALTSPVDIRPDHLAIVRNILRAHLPTGFNVWVFGSRANWTTKDSSDLDLAVEGPTRLDHKTMGAIEVAFEESNLPYTVDVVDLNAVSHAFKRIVEEQRVALSWDSYGNGHTPSNGWREVTLGEFAPFTYGKGLRTDDRIPSGDVPVIGSNGIIDYHDKSLTDGPTIVIGRKGTVGAVHYSPIPCWPIDTTFFITDDDPELLKFKYYALKVLPLQDMNSDSAVPGLNRDDAHACLLRVPGEAEQRAIAHVLGTLDDKIELNRRMNATLEAMARALFKSWFVDFEPVRAKMEGRWRPGESLPGLPAEHYYLFPDTLVPSPLGDIPAGWEVRRLGEVVEIVKGCSYRSRDLRDSTTALVTLKSIPRGGGYSANGLKPYVGPYSPQQVVQPGDVVVAQTDVTQAADVIGRSGRILAATHFDTLVASLDLLVVMPKAPVERSFLYGLLNDPAFHAHTLAYVNGTTVLHLSKNAVPEYQFTLPKASVLKAFADQVEPLWSRLDSNWQQSFGLTTQRDTLLPKLVSGEMRV